MEMHILPWIKDDIAIEIIGKMIAEQMQQVYKLVADYERKGYSHDSQEVMNDPEHQQLIMRIGEFKAEIDQIYAGKLLEELYKKVDEVYAPHLKKRYMSKKEVGFIKSSEKDTFVSASDFTGQVAENKPPTPKLESATQLSNNH